MASDSQTQNEAGFVSLLKYITLKHKCKMHMSVLTVSSLRYISRLANQCFPLIPFMSHTVTGRMDVGTRHQTETASLGASHLFRVVRVWWPH